MMKEKLVIVVAPTGSLTSRKDCAYIPITPEEQAEEAYRCYNAGATIYHVHARDPKTHLCSADISVYNDIVRRIKEKCPILTQMGGAIGFFPDPATGKTKTATEEQRLALLDVKPKPDLVTAPAGSLHHLVAGYESALLSNTESFLKKIIPTAISRKICVEIEIFDVSFLYNALRLAEQGVFNKDQPGYYLHYVMGLGGQPPTFRQLMYISEEGKRLFPKAKWQVLGNKENQFPILTMGILLGCDIVRIGAEDNPFLSNGELAKSNVQMVENAVRIARELGRDIATVEEAKEMLMPR
jgi:3-keto-5-aminohexanoate cleavage enzyme